PVPVACLPSLVGRLGLRQPPVFALFPYTTLFRSSASPSSIRCRRARASAAAPVPAVTGATRAAPPPGRGPARPPRPWSGAGAARSEEHTSELQSRENLVCRLLLEKKKKTTTMSSR